jgi:hypothetical protein
MGKRNFRILNRLIPSPQINHDFLEEEPHPMYNSAAKLILIYCSVFLLQDQSILIGIPSTGMLIAYILLIAVAQSTQKETLVYAHG